jgi:hypothetical protein
MAAPPVPNIAAGNAAFSTAMRAFHTWEATDLVAALDSYENTRLLSTTDTSVTSNTIGTGDKTFTVSAGRGFVAGQSLNIANTATPSNYMSGIVKSYSSTTLIVTVITTGGAGTFTAWSIALGLSGGGASLGTNTFNGVQNFAQGADIASAATINLTTATGNTLTITGTVATSAVTLGAGMTRLVRAAGAWPLTYNATTNNITGGVSTVLSAGDHVLYHNISGVIYGLIIKQNGLSAMIADKIQPATCTQSAGALTFGISASSLDFRSTTLTTGVPVTINNAALSLVLPSGGTLGFITTVLGRAVLVAINNAGTTELAVINQAGGNSLDETGLINTTAIGAGSTSANVFYSTTARTGVAYRVVGFVDAINTAGAWGNPSLVQGFGGNNNIKSASMVRLHTANGYGSTNTVIRRFTTVLKNQGSDITYSDSATLGTTFTINASGVYAISYTENFTNSYVGISLNSTQLTTGIQSINATDALALAFTAITNGVSCAAWTGYLLAGDVIRPHCNAVAAGSTPTQFTIARVV